MVKTTTNNPQWISSYFKNDRKGNFIIDGVSVNSIIKKVGAPLFIYSSRDISSRFSKLEEALKPHNISIYFSVKANTSRAIVQGLKNLGSGLEIASIGELEMAKAVGINPKHVSFAGPVKTVEELTEAIPWGIGTINVEHFEEFAEINRIAKKLGKKQKVGIRINPEKEVEGAGGLMGGGPKKFGIDVEKLTPQAIKQIQNFSSIDLCGIHIFAATQMLNVSAFLSNLKNVCDIAENINTLFPVTYIDFGGGLGIPYKENDATLPLEKISEVIGKTLRKYKFLKENKTEMYVEPGRFLTGPCGIYVARVDHLKKSRGVEYVMVDGGWHHMMRTSPRMPFSQHPVYNLSRQIKKGKKMTIGGSLCTSIDLLGENILLPDNTQTNDLIGVFNAGAYGRSQSPEKFLSHPTAAEVLVANGKFMVIRESESPKEWIKKQKTAPKEYFS